MKLALISSLCICPSMFSISIRNANYLVEGRSVINNNYWKNCAQGLEYSLRLQAILKDNQFAFFSEDCPLTTNEISKIPYQDITILHRFQTEMEK